MNKPRYVVEPEDAGGWHRVRDDDTGDLLLRMETAIRCALYVFALNAYNDDLELVAVVSRFQVIPSAGGRTPRIFEDPAKAVR